MSAIISGIAGAVGVAVLMATVKTRPKIIGDLTIIQYGMPLKVFSFIVFVVAIGASYAAGHAKPDQIIPAVLVTIGMYIVALSLMMEFNVVEISYDKDKIYTRSPWRRSRIIPLSDVIGIKYSHISNWHVIETKSYGCIRIHDGLNGRQVLIDLIKGKIQPAENESS